MTEIDYTGKTFDFTAMPTWTIGGRGTLFMFRNNNGEYEMDVKSNCNFWMKDFNNDFQIMENVCNALEYVDEMQDSDCKKKILDVLDSMKGHIGGQKLSQQIGFFCELGCWKNKEVRNENLFDEDFEKYAQNCLRMYNDYI